MTFQKVSNMFQNEPSCSKEKITNTFGNASNIQTTYSNRIPQPSIINSATGNMNQMIGRNTISGGSSGF